MKVLDIFKKKPKLPRFSAVVLAAGLSERMCDDKIFMQLDGMPILARTLLAFQKSELVNEIVVVTRMDKVMDAAGICKTYGIDKVSKVIRGGATRMESALAGVSEVCTNAKLIAIHDGARPLVSQDVIERTAYAAAEHLAAAPVVCCTDTLKVVNDKKLVTGTLDRDCIVRIQTPQIFDADLIKGALTKAAKDALRLTDDCAAIELMGVKTFTVEGDEDNIKLTTPRDIAFAEAVLNRGE